MKKNAADKKTILKAVAKMVATKEAVRAYIKGETSIQTIAQKGIKLAKPL